jgi:hypothetical protein
MGVFESIGYGGDRFQGRQLIEKWVSRPGDQNTIPGVAEKLEKIGISFRGRGAEKKALGIDVWKFAPSGREMLGDGSSGVCQALRFGIV